MKKTDSDVDLHFLLIEIGAVENGRKGEVDPKIDQPLYVEVGNQADGDLLDFDFSSPFLDGLVFGSQFIPRLVECFQDEVGVFLYVAVVDRPDCCQIDQLNKEIPLAELHLLSFVLSITAFAGYFLPIEA